VVVHGRPGAASLPDVTDGRAGASDDRLPTAVTDALIGEIEGLLAGYRRRFADRPDRERRALLVTALEREQVVAVAYRESAVAGRLDALPLDEDVRRLVRQCLVWIWQDEEVHATFLRGYLLRAGRSLPAGLIFGRQLYGALSGWVTSSRELEPTGSAPWRGATAGALLLGGRLVGLVSPVVARELGYHSFGRYCQLNAALERTAELAYRRLVEIAADDDERRLFERIRQDEQRHAEAFDLLAGLLDPADAPVPGLDGADLCRRLEALSPFFVPAALRTAPPARARSFDSASVVATVDGDPGGDVAAVVEQALEDGGVARLVRQRGGVVAVRTSFMLGYDRRDVSNVVSPAVLDALAGAARRWGASDVAVIEAPTVYGRYFRRRSVAGVAAYFGYHSPHYRLVDAAADQVAVDYQRGLQQNTVSRTWLEADVRIVVAKLRTDPNEFGHLCLCSLEGMASQIADTMYASRTVDFRAATMMLLDVAPPDAAVVDAWGPVADGPVGVMGCRRPPVLARVYAGLDALSVDIAVLADMGLADPTQVPIIRRAMQWFGREATAPARTGTGGPLGAGFRHPWSGPGWKSFARLTYPVYVYLSGEGRLFVPAMDTTAFPPVGRDGPGVRLLRRAAQRSLGLRPG